MTECLKVDPDKVRRLSLSEEQLEDASEKYGTQIVRYPHEFLLANINSSKKKGYYCFNNNNKKQHIQLPYVLRN